MLHRYRRTLIELFAQVKGIQSDPFGRRDQCLRIQETLVDRITYVERRIRRLRLDNKSGKKSLADPIARLSKTDAAILKQRMVQATHAIAAYQNLLRIFREVGDALAFSYLSKWDIKPMAFKASTGFLSGKTGSRLERRIAREAFANGFAAILNDLTNCLRYGDVTVVNHDGEFGIIEAKSGAGQTSRDKRQSDNLGKLVDYLVTDDSNGVPSAARRIRRVSHVIPETNHRLALADLIAKARESGAAYKEVERGLFYAVQFDESPIVVDAIVKRVSGPPIVAMLNAHKGNNTGYYPFTLSFSDPVALYEFYAGAYAVFVVLDKVHIDACLRRSGVGAQWNLDGELVLHLGPLKRRPGDPEQRLSVGRHFLGRLFCEFLSLTWILEEIVVRYRSAAIGPQSGNTILD